MTRIISLCTGNAARSVMLGALLQDRRPDLEVVTAGTHVIDGQPISRRTRAGLSAVGLRADHHRSRQLDPADLSAADLVIGMAHEHIAWIRRRHPDAADRTGTVRLLSLELGPGPEPLRSGCGRSGWRAAPSTRPATWSTRPAGRRPITSVVPASSLC
jgi:protein-tyrosine phosphatase